MLMRHSPRGLPSSAVLADSAVVMRVSGSGWWKYQYNVAHSIMAICRLADVAGLKSLLLGLEMEEM